MGAGPYLARVWQSSTARLIVDGARVKALPADSVGTKAMQSDPAIQRNRWHHSWGTFFVEGRLRPQLHLAGLSEPEAPTWVGKVDRRL